MNKNKCIIKNCENIDCVDFPKDAEERSKWIDILKLSDDLLEDACLCLDHFKDVNLSDSREDDTSLENLKNETLICHDIKTTKTEQKEKEEVQKKETEDDALDICRICAEKEHLEKSVDDSINDEMIGTMIMLCCHPVIVSRHDGLPNKICTFCLKELEAAYNFRRKCLEVNDMWQKQNTSRKRKHNDSTDIANKKKCLENVPKTGKLNMEKNRVDLNKLKIITMKNDPPPLVPIERNTNRDKQNNDKNKFGRLEIKTERTSIYPKIKQEEPIPSTSKNQIIKDKDDNTISLPKGITVKASKKFQSNTGQYSCTITHGLQESVFIMANEYLFTFGLLKGNVRHLRCVLPNCRAKAEQKLDSKRSNNQIIVKVAHNHRPPNEQLRKKHMFFHVMRKRMQHDKTLNILSIYEQVCAQEPEIRRLVPVRNVINEICKHQVSNKLPRLTSFKAFYDRIEDECFEQLHFTDNSKQFYQEKFQTDDGAMAILFCNTDSVKSVSKSKLMYVDASFKIETFEDFKYQLVTVLVWVNDSYYPVLYALVNKKTQDIFRKIFKHLHDVLAPDLRPHEIVTDYEANIYYALGETYLESHIGGSVFYYIQNLYKKICSLNLSRDLETNSNFRNLYHMLLMLPLLPVNTILDALNNIELQAKELLLGKVTKPIFDHIRSQWILNVTAEMFCVHRLENRINENVIAPFKKFRDYLLLFKGKINQTHITIAQVVEKLIELESFLNEVYTKPDKKSFGRDLSSFQKKNVIRTWQYIETHPKININNFFQKVLGYIKCMENQLWIWGFYRYGGSVDDVLISGGNSSMYISESGQIEEPEHHEEVEEEQEEADADEVTEYIEECEETTITEENDNPTIVMEAVIDNDGGVVLQSNEMLNNSKFEKAFFKFVRYE